MYLDTRYETKNIAKNPKIKEIIMALVFIPIRISNPKNIILTALSKMFNIKEIPFWSDLKFLIKKSRKGKK